MNRPQATELLKSLGIEEPTRTQVDLLMANYKAQTQESIEQAIEQAKKDAETTANEKFKDYKTAEEYQTLERELADLKDSKAKTERTSKYTAKGISEKYHDYADSKLKDSKEFDKDLEEFIKNNAELVSKAKDEPKPQPKQIVFGKVETNKETPTTAQTMRSAVAEYYENLKK